MKAHFAYPLKFCVGLLVTLVTLTSLLAWDLHASPRDDYKKHPGYIDFDALGVASNMEASVEVYLKGSLLSFVTEALREDEPELAAILDKILLVRANVFPLDAAQEDEVTKKAQDLAGKLEKKGWDIAVRVKEEDQNVYIYTLPGKDNSLDGLVVMVVEMEGRGRHADNEFTFVNIVGSIKPEDIGRLSRVMDINGVDIDHIYDNGHRSRRN